MHKSYKIMLALISIGFLFPHGVSKSTAQAMKDGSIMDFIYFGAEHMVTGYDHILFLIGILFFLTRYLDIFKFITAFTIAHCITLIFATSFKITANANLIDAVIAFSVIYKGFENLNGFKKWFSINTPNLLLMVFVFGLIHGFGLSSKLQEVAVEQEIQLNLLNILSFNVGVELGQIIVLIIIFPLLLILRKGSFFGIISKISNWSLIFAGLLLLIYQLNLFFTSEGHYHDENVNQTPKHLEHDKHHHNHNHDVYPHTH